MSIDIVTRLLKQKEDIRLEFKEARMALPSNLFETVCVMLNREGGDILLGADDTVYFTDPFKNRVDKNRSCEPLK